MSGNTSHFALACVLASLVLSSQGALSAGFPDTVKAVTLKPNTTVTIEGNLAQGISVSDLSWASNSAVACFPATQNSHYRAPHALFHVKLPPHSILKVKLIPADRGKPMSLYAYQMTADRFDVVPNLSRVVTCEASYPSDRPFVGRIEDGTRKVELNAINDNYNVVIGVSGNEGASGSFSLELTLKQ